MSRTYTQVLEDVVKNQSVQIAQLVATNEELSEQLVNLNATLSASHNVAKSGGQLFDIDKVLRETNYERESKATD